ncbi:MAG: LysE family translocator [Burkholderiales bacterium]|nr:LysE family translocator [Burkholderiales bacterium]
MIELSTLAAFSGAVFLLLLSPGPNMAFIMACGARYGHSGGIAAAMGIGVADIVLTILTASGITAIVAAWAPSFDLIRYAGVVYLLWLATKNWKNSPVSASTADSEQATQVASLALQAVFLRAMLNSLLNPKALLFFLVFLPQFTSPAKGGVAMQLLILGLTLSLISTIFHGLLGSFGNLLQRRLAGRSQAKIWQARLLTAVLVLLAIRLVLLERPLS